MVPKGRSRFGGVKIEWCKFAKLRARKSRIAAERIGARSLASCLRSYAHAGGVALLHAPVITVVEERQKGRVDVKRRKGRKRRADMRRARFPRDAHVSTARSCASVNASGKRQVLGRDGTALAALHVGDFEQTASVAE